MLYSLFLITKSIKKASRAYCYKIIITSTNESYPEGKEEYFIVNQKSLFEWKLNNIWIYILASTVKLYKWGGGAREEIVVTLPFVMQHRLTSLFRWIGQLSTIIYLSPH